MLKLEKSNYKIWQNPTFSMALILQTIDLWKKILLDRVYEKPLFAYSRLIGMAIL